MTSENFHQKCNYRSSGFKLASSQIIFIIKDCKLKSNEQEGKHFSFIIRLNRMFPMDHFNQCEVVTKAYHLEVFKKLYH